MFGLQGPRRETKAALESVVDGLGRRARQEEHVSRGGKREKEGLTQTLKLRFLYVTDSTLKPIVGIVVTTSPICPRMLAHHRLRT